MHLGHDAEGWFELWVTDDGVGIPEHVEIDSAPTLGLQLVVLLADQLGGSFSMQRACPTRCALRFPDRAMEGTPS